MSSGCDQGDRADAVGDACDGVRECWWLRRSAASVGQLCDTKGLRLFGLGIVGMALFAEPQVVVFGISVLGFAYSLR